MVVPGARGENAATQGVIAGATGAVPAVRGED